MTSTTIQPPPLESRDARTTSSIAESASVAGIASGSVSGSTAALASTSAAMGGAASTRPFSRRMRSAPRQRREIGVQWHGEREWRSLVTGGVAAPTSRTRRSAWRSVASIVAIASVAGAAAGIGATRLGWIPSSGVTPVVLAAIAIAASGAFAILACCVDIDRRSDDPLAGEDGLDNSEDSPAL